MRFLIFILGFLFSAISYAVPVTWTLQDVLLDDDTYLTGSFVFDADAPADVDTGWGYDAHSYYSDFNLQFSLGEGVTVSLTNDNSYVEYAPYVYSDDWHGGGSRADHLFVRCYIACVPGDPYENSGLESGFDVHLFFADGLMSGTGVVSLGSELGLEALSFGFDSGEVWPVLRPVVDPDPEYIVWSFSPLYIISGSVVSSVVPIPAAVWLFGSALAGLGWLRRKPA